MYNLKKNKLQSNKKNNIKKQKINFLPHNKKN